jgi:hypothetical protein
MRYSLRRLRDNAGDEGLMSQAINPKTMLVESNRPQVGCVMRVGSHFARSFQYQDYWTTTPVTEIINDTEEQVHFRTGNSEYIWKVTS